MDQNNKDEQFRAPLVDSTNFMDQNNKDEQILLSLV